MLRIAALAACSLLLLLAGLGCSSAGTSSTAQSEPSRAAAPTSASVSQSEGRALADEVAEAVIADDEAAVYDLMHSVVRETMNSDDLDLEVVYAYGGRPLEAEYKMDSAGELATPQGLFPIRKYWYAVRTEQADMGTYFMAVEVAQDAQGPACMSFAVVSFLDGAPEGL